MKKQDTMTTDQVGAISSACKGILITTRSIELAKLQGDYATEKLLKRSLVSKYGKGGDVTTLKRIATDTVKRCFTAKRNGESGEPELTRGFESMLKVCGIRL